MFHVQAVPIKVFHYIGERIPRYRSKAALLAEATQHIDDSSYILSTRAVDDKVGIEHREKVTRELREYVSLHGFSIINRHP